MKRPELTFVLYLIAPVLVFCASCTAHNPVPTIPAWSELPPHGVVIEQDEKELWEEARGERELLEKDGLILKDEALTSYLNEVLGRLLSQPLPPQVPRPTVQVVRVAERNAAAAPDGVILITTSLLAALANEAQLAALLGHELGHFVGRHGVLRRRFDKVSRSTIERMRFSRHLETYADRFAFDAVWRAGYDVREIPAMLRLIETEDGAVSAGTPYAFRSHPFVSERIGELERSIREQARTDAELGTDRYVEAVAELLAIAAEVELEARNMKRAGEVIERLLLLRPRSGRAHYLKAEHIRRTAPDGRRSHAVRAQYERAVELSPDDPDALRALGLLYHGEGNLDPAIKLLQRYLSLAPDAADSKLIEKLLVSPPRPD